MKIILDARKIKDYGIGVYLKNLFQGLINSGVHDCRILHLKGTEYLKAPGDSFVEVSYKNYDPREHLEIPMKVRDLRNFHYFSPHYVFPLFLKQKLLVTVHDLIHFKFARLFRPAVKVEMAKFFMKKLKSRAERVFAVSKTTRNDLIELFGFRDDRIKVIYHGVSDHFFVKPRQAHSFEFPYILYTGNLKPHKNLALLLKAFSLVREKYPDLRLILVGFEENKAFIHTVNELRLQERILVKGFLSNEDMTQFIDGAEFFVFPSLYEGFGLPPLEAMARGKAVLSSPGGSLREILGENALYFDPESHEELAAKMALLLEDEELRKKYQEKGYGHSRSFRWKRAVEEYLKILQEMG